MRSELVSLAGFFTWHWALRQAGVRLETRTSARLYAVGAFLIVALVRRNPVLAAISALVLAAQQRQRRRGARDHFDDLAPDYAAQLSPDARERVVRRKTALMSDVLGGAGPAASSSRRILDVGCGHGWYIAALAQEGIQAVGLDLSPQQLVAARESLGASAKLTAGSVLQLPVTREAFDAAYAVNVLHHVEAWDLQAAALDQLALAVRPGGLVFLHEINTRNPLFAFYMSYVFPLWKRIDLGTERWLDPQRLPVSLRLTLEEVRCYTFLPDFTPHWLVSRLEPLEHALEHAAPSWSAHFTAIYRRLPDAPSA